MPTRQELETGAFVVGSAFISDTPVLALGDGTVRLIIDGREHVAQVHDGAVLVATASHDGKTFLTGGDDGKVAATAAEGEVRTLAERPRKWIDHLASAPNGAVAFAVGRQAVVIDTDGTERSFDHDRAVGGLAFAPKGFRLAVARYDGVTMWWAGRDADPATLDWKGAHIGVTFAPDGKTLVTSMQENALHGWRLADEQDMRMSGYPAKPRSLSWSVRGRYLASSGANAAVLWPFHHKDGPMGKQPLQLGPREETVTVVACHPRRESVAIGYRDGAIIVADVEGVDDLAVKDASGSPVSTLAWDGRGDRLLYGTEAGTAGIVDMNSD